MKKMILALTLVLALSACTTTAGYVNCDNARAAVEAAAEAVRYACPVPENDLQPAGK